jgi:hypothetical protein
MNSKYTYELPWEAVDDIITGELMSDFESMKQSLHNRMEGRHHYKAPGIFSNDEAEDIAAITEHMYALSLILRYYGVNVNE